MLSGMRVGALLAVALLLTLVQATLGEHLLTVSTLAFAALV